MRHVCTPTFVSPRPPNAVKRSQPRRQATMATKWTFQPSESGPKLFGLSYESSSPVAMLFWHHGITEHCSRYEKMFSFLSTHGISCHSYDARGHGLSEPNDSERMHVLFDTLVEDFVELCKQKKAENPGLPCFLGGQSMGGLVSCYAALQNQDWFNGLLITSPAMDVDKNLVLKIQSLLGGPMEAIAPKARIVPAVKVEDMSESEEVRESIRSDPLICHTNIPVKTARQVEGAMNRLKASYPKFTMPIYGMHGSSDRCTSMRGHKAFMDGVSSTDKTFDEIPGGYHELLMGPQKEECYQKMSTWMLAHTGPKPQIKTPL